MHVCSCRVIGEGSRRRMSRSMAQMDDANKRTATASDTVTRVLGHCLAREATARAKHGWEIVRRVLKAHTNTHTLRKS
jgi:hypothetical protein